MWDERQAKYADDITVKAALSKGLFLDGDAAKCLCERGYGEYLGVEVGEDTFEGTNLQYDLAVREVICEKFARAGKGRHMTPAFMYSPSGNGRLLNISVTRNNEWDCKSFCYDFIRIDAGFTYVSANVSVVFLNV